MPEYEGWLLDLYTHPKEGAVLWLLGEDGERRRLRHAFPVTFYAAGPPAQLRALWHFLQNQAVPLELARVQRTDLFAGPLTVLAAQAPDPLTQVQVFRAAAQRFPNLDYFDADIPLALRYGARYGLYPLGRCRVRVDANQRITQVQAISSPWAVEAEAPPPLRILALEPDSDPARRTPKTLRLHYQGRTRRLSLEPARALLIGFRAILQRFDPDLILSNWGDTWLLPRLLELAQQHNIHFNLNRDPDCEALQRAENSYFAYGQVIYRGAQLLLFGRWHIDRLNAVMYGDHGLEGIFEQARVTGLPIQEIARKSPGAGITALQIQHALRQGILTPYRKQQVEGLKTLQDLVRLDQGGLVYQPLAGLHQSVAEIDFISMYPSVMVHFNISPETVSARGERGTAVSELGLHIDLERPGLAAQTLRPLLERRIAIKQQLGVMDRRDRRYAAYKARSTALKWLLVVCFGYLGYKNARFGRIEAHQAVTAYGREALLRAKEAAEDLGYTVLHMYVDGLWVKKAGQKLAPADLQPLLDEILKRTGLPIALEGIYRWVVFLSSRQDARVPVANRYFGAFQDGSLKIRGIEARRHDTPAFIAQTQVEILEMLAQAQDAEALESYLPAALAHTRSVLRALNTGQLPLEALLVRQKLSRPLEAYRSPSPAARAALQLQAIGKTMRPGQAVRFFYTRGEPGVYAWDLPEALDPQRLDLARYRKLLIRAVSAILEPLGIGEDQLEVHIRCAPERGFQERFHIGDRLWAAAGRSSGRQTALPSGSREF